MAFGYFWYFPVYVSATLRYLSERMRNLLKDVGLAFDFKTSDEASILLQAINLLENKFGARREDTSGKEN